MSQHDFVIDNGGGSTVRGDLNNALQALASRSSGAAAPSTPYADMEWIDTAKNVIWRRNSTNTAWILAGPRGPTMVLPNTSGGFVLSAADHAVTHVVSASTVTVSLSNPASLGNGWYTDVVIRNGTVNVFCASGTTIGQTGAPTGSMALSKNFRLVTNGITDTYVIGN